MSAESGMQAWLAARIETWRRLTPTLERLERERKHAAGEALQAIELYRSLGRDLSTARRLLPDTRVTRALEQRYAKLHAIIHREPNNWGARLKLLFREEIPEVMSELATPIRWVALLFILSALAGWWLIMSYPELVSLLASEEMINGVESGRLWTDDLLNVTPSSVLSVGILANNIAVSLMAFCLGALFGLGTLYIIGMNGLMLGAVFAFTHQHGMSDELFRFVIAHGVVELSVVVIAGAAGVMVGEALIRPAHGGRRESFQRAAARTSRVLLLCAVLLIGCGFIEGYISPNPQYSLPMRIFVGLAYGAVMIAAATGKLFGRKSAADERERPKRAAQPG